MQILNSSREEVSLLETLKRDRWFWVLMGFFVLSFVVGLGALAQESIPVPGDATAAQKLEGAGTLLRIVDTALFGWLSKLFAGIALLSAGLQLKEQRYSLAAISIVAAIFLGTASTWVKNIFSIGEDSGGVFSTSQITWQVDENLNA